MTLETLDKLLVSHPLTPCAQTLSQLSFIFFTLFFVNWYIPELKEFFLGRGDIIQFRVVYNFIVKTFAIFVNSSLFPIIAIRFPSLSKIST